MRHWLIVAVVAIVIALGLLWLCGRNPETARAHDAVPAVPAAPNAADPELKPMTAPTLAPRERVPVAEIPAPSAEAKATQATATPAPPDLAARDWLEIRVVDPGGLPVFDAELSIDGVRKEEDAGSWYEMRDGPATARTDAQGLARISYVRWVDIDGRTNEVDLEVKHPEFVAFRDSSFAIGSGQHPVVLQRGATVVVSGWFGSPELVLTDIVVQADRDAQLSHKAWKREADGRLSTSRLAPGKHLLWLTSEGQEHGKLASAIESFELSENEWKELHIELHALAVLQGRLDDSVPRPVLDGHVMLNLHQGGLGADEPSIDRDFESVVHDDGTFEVPDLPPGKGQIIALCRGWISRRTRADSPEEAGMSFGNYEPTPDEIEEAMRDMGDQAFEPQRISLPSSSPFVVAMEPTGALEVTVRTQDGGPLAGALIAASPNVSWIGVGSTIFPWGEWNATTDSAGRARIENLPPDHGLWVDAGHSSFRMPRAQRDDSPRVPIVSGQTATFEFTLEPGTE